MKANGMIRLVLLLCSISLGSSLYVVKDSTLYAVRLPSSSMTLIAKVPSEEVTIDSWEKRIAYVQYSGQERHVYLKSISKDDTVKIDLWSSQNYGPEISPGGTAVIFHCLGKGKWKLCHYDRESKKLRVFPEANMIDSDYGINEWIGDSTISIYEFNSIKMYNTYNNLFLREHVFQDTTKFWFSIPGSKSIFLKSFKAYLVQGVNANSDARSCDGPCDNAFFVDSLENIKTIFPNSFQISNLFADESNAYANVYNEKSKYFDIYKIDLRSLKYSKMKMYGKIVGVN